MDTLLTGPRSIPPYTGAAIMAIILGGPNRDEKGWDASQGSGANVVRSGPIYSFFVVFYSLDQGWGIMARFIRYVCWLLFALARVPISRGAEILKDTNWRCPLYGVVLVIAGFFTLLPGRVMH